MSNSIINPTSINIYGINAFINKFSDSKLDILDLYTIKNNFKIDFEFDNNLNQIEESDLPAFTQLTFNQIVTDVNTSYSTSYNRPPLGPIENFCYCSYCTNIAPQYHTEDCSFPERKSLFLTLEGIYYYIIQNKKYTFSKNINEFKQLWLENKLTINDLNNFLLIPNSIKFKSSDFNGNFIKSEKIPLNNTLTKIQYFDVVKLRGPTKLEYTTATQKFSNAIMLSYEYIKKPLKFEIESQGQKEKRQEEEKGQEGKQLNIDNDFYNFEETSKKTSIRIYRNGLINLINVPSSDYYREILYKTLIDRINEASYDTINMDYFNKMASEFTDEEFDEFGIVDDASYIHSVNSQFNLWQVKDKFSINFVKLNNLITPYNSSGKIVSGEFTNVSNNKKTNKQIIELKYKSNSVFIVNWEHSLGKDTKNQILTREEIKCIILPINGIKISLQIHKHGTFQMSMSYCNVSDIKNSICNNILDKSIVKLDFKYFEIVKEIFVGIFLEKPNLTSLSLDYSDENIAIKNTVSGNAPPNKPNTSTAVCRNNDPRPGYPSLRPIPYSFQGKCPESRQYIDPIGILGNDGLYYPCCSAKSKKSEEEYKQYLIEGFPRNDYQSKLYGITKLEDSKSGILIPGSLNIGAITKAKINDIFTPVRIIGYKGKSKKPTEIIVQNLNTNNIISVNRSNLERDSRYFPGLKSFSKEQLIKCIIKNLQLKKNSMSVLELENLYDIKKLINFPEPNFNPIMSIYNISTFEFIKYYVTSVPNNSNMFYFYINQNNSYFINIFGNKKIKGLNEIINEEIIFLGFLENNSEKYFITDILYFNKPLKIKFSEKLAMLKEIEETFFLTENTIVFPNYESNIIKGSKDLLQESSDIFLVFTPQTNYLDFKIWTNVKIDTEITLQIIKKPKTNYFTLGYENNLLEGLSINFDSIFIPKIFIDSNQIKVNDYILFKFDFNLQTNELSTRILTPLEKSNKPDLSFNETLTKISLIINPINESFFINNRLDDDYIWSIPKKDKILKYVSDDELPLINYD